MSAKIIICFAVVCALFGSLKAFGVNVDQQLCPKVCPYNYSPVCGTDGENFREFANDCLIKAANCQNKMNAFVTTHIDMCRTELVNGLDNLMVKLGNLNINKPECERLCNKMYEPMCISNGKYRTFVTNSCFMDTINCVVAGTQDAFQVIRQDTC